MTPDILKQAREALENIAHLESVVSHYAENSVMRQAVEQHAKSCREILSCLSAEPSAIPDGWVLVPREPTEEMKHKGASFYRHFAATSPCIPNDIYRVMLSAAPKPPEQVTE